MKFKIGEVDFSISSTGISVWFKRDGHDFRAAVGLPTGDMPTLDLSFSVDGKVVEIGIPWEVESVTESA